MAKMKTVEEMVADFNKRYPEDAKKYAEEQPTVGGRGLKPRRQGKGRKNQAGNGLAARARRAVRGRGRQIDAQVRKSLGK